MMVPSPRAVLRAADAAAAAMGLGDDDAVRIAEMLDAIYAPPPLPWKMPRKATRVVNALMAAKGKPVSGPALLAAMDAPDVQSNMARVMVCVARRRLPDPTWIACVWGHGYRWAGPSRQELGL